jgi:uncharacterized Zn finger protein
VTCDKCGNEKFNTIRVFRNRRRENGTWKFEGKCDTRLIACSECGQRYLTETHLHSSVDFKNFKRIEINPNQEEFIF